MANAQSEPSMDEILASIRRIISEEDDVAPDSNSDQDPLNLDESTAVKTDPIVSAQDALAKAKPSAADGPAEKPAAAQPAPAKPAPVKAAVAETPAPVAAAAPAESAPKSAPVPEVSAESPAAPEASAVVEVAQTPTPPAADPVDDFDNEPEAAPVAGIFERPESVSPERLAANMATAAASQLISDGTASQAAEAFGSLERNVRMSTGSGRSIEDLIESMLAPMLQGWLDDNLSRIVEEKVEEEVRRIARRG